MLRISLGGPALSGGRRFRQRLPVAGTISASTMHLSGAWTDEASANSCNPCDRVSRGHSVGFTQFAVTADRTPRIFANAMSSCGIGYPHPGLATTARPLTYPGRSLPERELGLSPPRSHPRFGPSCGRIGYCRPMKVPFVRTLERCAFQRFRFFFFADAQSKVQNACRTSSPDFPPVSWGKTCFVHVRGLGEKGAPPQRSSLFARLLWCCAFLYRPGQWT